MISVPGLELRPEHSASIICTLSSKLNNGDLSRLIATPITSLSTNKDALFMISMWPKVIGSNVPGYRPTRPLFSSVKALITKAHFYDRISRKNSEGLSFLTKRQYLKLTDQFKDARPSYLHAYTQLTLTFRDHSDFLWI